MSNHSTHTYCQNFDIIPASFVYVSKFGWLVATEKSMNFLEIAFSAEKVQKPECFSSEVENKIRINHSQTTRLAVD